MGLEYLAYLGFTLLGTLLLLYFSKIPFRNMFSRPFFMAILVTALIFMAWDIWAVYLGHWTFGLSHMVGIIILNQPLEEILFFFVIPFFYLVCWVVLRERFS